MKRKILAVAFCLVAAPAVMSAQSRGGITKVELLALQQQMRDEGCGNRRAPGVWNAETRRAIVTCSKKHNSSTNAKQLLVAMNIGFGPNDNAPSAGAIRAGGDTGANLGAERGSNVGSQSTTTTTPPTPTTVTTPVVTPPMPQDSMMKRDSMMKDSMMKDSMMKDSMMKDSTMKRDSTAKRDSTSRQ